MTRKVICGLSLLLLCGDAVWAQGLPSCRVRVVRSGLTRAVSSGLLKQVESWANAPDRGSTVVATINEADILLELTAYKLRSLADGSPAEQWLFTVRRLADSSPDRALYRFGYFAGIDPRSQAGMAERLQLVLGDVCLGYLPKRAAVR